MALFKSFKTVLVLLLSAVFVAAGVQNLSDRLGFRLFYDGAVWAEDESGLIVERIEQPLYQTAEGQALQSGDRLLGINQIEIRDRQDYEEVADYLETLPQGQRVELQVRRAVSGKEALLTGPNQLRTALHSIDAILALTALAFLLAGCFIYLRNWQAKGAFHFYLLCLSAFIVLLYRVSGKGDPFDQAVYWIETLAWLLLPALLLHFSCFFPRKLPLLENMPRLRELIYLPAAGLAAVQALWFKGLLQPFGLAVTLDSSQLLDRIHLAYLTTGFLLAAFVLLRVQRSLASTVERSQLKWIAQGALWGTLPFAFFYALPIALGFEAGGLQQLSVLSLALIPLGFGYAITRYRLMDVDVIFKQGLSYALSSAALLGLYVVAVMLLGRAVQSIWTDSGFGVFALAALLMAFLFSPLKERIQSQIDRHFYKDQYNLRASFSEFGQTLGSEIQLPELNQRISVRIQGALDVSTVAVFLRDEADADLYHCIQAEPSGNAESRSARFPRELLAATRPIQIDLSAFETEREAQHAGAFQEAGIEYIQPLLVRRRAIGFLGLGRRRNGEPLSSEDLYLVSTLAGYAAIAIDNALLYDSLESKATQLSRLKAYNENVIESITVGVAVVDEEGTVRVWNSALEELYGLPRAEAAGKPLDSLLPSGLLTDLRALLDGPRWRVAATRHLYKTRLENRRRRELLANITLTPFVGGSQIDAGLLILFEDITEKSQLENQLLQAEKLSSIGLFAAGVAHEVNTPLAGISSYAQMMIEQTTPEDPRYEILRKIELQSVRASRMVNNLLNFARVSDSELAEVNLNNLMVETVSLLEHQFKRNRVEVQVDLDPYLPKTLAMGGKIQQVFMNLFLNAKDAMPDGGSLRVKTALEDGKAVVQVQDTGCGIAQQDIQKIYDPFFTTKDVGKGTGLGLSVSYGIVQEHAGQIHVESRPGQGTTFTVQIPVKRLQ